MNSSEELKSGGGGSTGRAPAIAGGGLERKASCVCAWVSALCSGCTALRLAAIAPGGESRAMGANIGAKTKWFTVVCCHVEISSDKP